MEQQYRVVELLKEIKSLILNKPKDDKWLNIKQASKYANVSDSSLRRAISNEQLPASKRLQKVLILKSNLEQWLNG